jgi:hypothetical protein
LEVTGGLMSLNLKLAPALEDVAVTVEDNPAALDVSPETDASALVIKGSELESLPDDPDELAATLQAMAGPAGGAGQFYLDGFQTSKLPSKRDIREVRINQNPFSAEFDRLGTNRIDIFTKPGTEKFHGQTFFSFNDESLNARNPFAARRAPFQSRLMSGGLSGPITKSSSFFLDFERRETDDNSVVRATLLDPLLNVFSFNESVPTPERRTSFSLRFDQKLNSLNTLVARYSYLNLGSTNAGVGGFSLASRAFDTSLAEHIFQVTETAVLSPRMINETRFQYVSERVSQMGDDSTPTVNVLDAFVGGGSPTGQSSERAARWELQNYSFWTIPRHNLKAGVRLRGVRRTEFSQRNFAGTYTFAGGEAARIGSDGLVVYDDDGTPSLAPLTSLERYRRALLFRRSGLPANAGSLSLGELGFAPTQFSITVGDPQAHVSQIDFAAFVQEDWRLRPNLTISAGLRYETQSNIRGGLNLAPRLRFAWSPMGNLNGRRGIVLRGGVGVFYDRFAEDLILQALRFDGAKLRQYIVTDPAALQAFPNPPEVINSGVSLVPQTIVRVADDARAPYTIQTALGMDYSLPRNTTVSLTYLNARSRRLLRSRNVNAPLTGTYTPGEPESGVRPLGGNDNVFTYESGGRAQQQQLLVRVNTRFHPRITMFATYVLNKAESDTEGAGSFPANSYDLSNEYGRSLLDVRQHFFLGGTINALWGLRLNPFIIASSGRPFNIITGRDTNGDTLFTERPAFATDLSQPGIVQTPLGAFDPDPSPGQRIIPRNYGTGPSLFTVNLRLAKTIDFGDARGATAGAAGGKSGGDFGDDAAGARKASEKRYSLTFSLRVQNLFNRVNAAPPIGNLGSLLFGQSVATAGTFNFAGGSPSVGNRRVEAQVGFSF